MLDTCPHYNGKVYAVHTATGVKKWEFAHDVRPPQKPHVHFHTVTHDPLHTCNPLSLANSHSRTIAALSLPPRMPYRPLAIDCHATQNRPTSMKLNGGNLYFATYEGHIYSLNTATGLLV